MAVSFAVRPLLAAAGIFVAPVQAPHVKVVAPVSLVAALACPSGDYGMATFCSGCLVYFASTSAAGIFVAPVQAPHVKVVAPVSLVAALASPSGDYGMATFCSGCLACFSSSTSCCRHLRGTCLVQAPHYKVIALVSPVATLACPSGDYGMATFSCSCFACFAFTATDTCWCWVGSSASAYHGKLDDNTYRQRCRLGLLQF